jgi:O-antigen ligase
LAFILIPRNGKTLIYLSIIFVFPAYCLITSIWSLNPIISLQRSLYLLLIYTGILSSVSLYKKIFPKKGIGFLIPANIIILIISAVSLIFGIPADSWSGGNGLGFMGFAGHQNTLAAVLLFTLPGIIAFGIEHKAKRKGYSKKHYFIFVFISLLLVSNVLLLILTYSRASILALVIGTITYLLITKSKNILSFIFSIAALLLVLYFTIPFIQNSFDSVLTKDGGKILGRRMILWEPSLEAAKLGGVFGLGYGVSAPDIKTPILTGSHYEDGRYIREKGNSVLAMIEETGLIGLILFLLPMIWIIRKFIIYNSQFTIKENFRSNSTFYIVHCTLFAMLVHAQFEAWWVAVGSIALPLFLIFLFMILSSEYFFNSNTMIE